MAEMVASNSSANAEEGVGVSANPFLHLTEEEIIQRVLGEHKPSRNPFVRGYGSLLGVLEFSSPLLVYSSPAGQQPHG